MSNPDTGVTISGSTLTIRTGTRYRPVVVPGLAQMGIDSSALTFYFYDPADVAVQAAYRQTQDIVWRKLKEDSAHNYCGIRVSGFDERV